MTHVDWDWRTPVLRPWLERLSLRHRLVRYDSRGSGLSQRDIATFGLDELVADLEAVVDACGLQRFALLGASQGGATAIAYAARHPQRVTHLVLMNAYARGTLVRSPEKRSVVEATAELMRTGWGQENPAFRQMMTMQFLPGGTPEQVRAFNELQKVSCTPEHAARMVLALSRVDASPALAAIRCPTLVMHCRGDARVPFDEGLFIASEIAGAVFEPLESDNHYPMEGEPAFDRAMELIAHFVAAPDAPGGLPMLSARQREVLGLLARGLDNAQIAAHLGIAEKTVRNTVSGLFDRLGVENRPQAIVLARNAGLGG
jgi:pimeloyl-ACP methyl ester carboxylesterase/DNA-binding CsgD family transcriptional regulator